MSGLVSGLQNRVRRFESARNLKQKGELEKSNSPFCLEWFASLINSEISLVQCKYSIQNNKKKAAFILGNPLSKLSDLYSNELKDLAVVWCYYSGKIEGNTYTYVETEALLKDGITSEKKYEDAKMLKNLYNTFISELEYINKGKNLEHIDERTLFRVHQSISTGLVSNEESGSLRTRAVRITGTVYIPRKTYKK